MNNPWNLTTRECEALARLAEVGCHKKVAESLGVGKARVSRLISAAARRMGKPTQLLTVLEWDRWTRTQ